MEENQSVASESSNIAGIPSSDHASVAEAGCGNLADPSLEAVGSSSHDMNVDSQVASSIAPDIPLGTAVDAENAADASNTMDYSYVNGSAGELGSHQSAGVSGNGVMSNGEAGPFAEQHLEDVNSAEEDRLWGMVTANCLDFNAWTALIDETEKVAENNIMKIRKVYDAFLAEFPLCFGYWKKYADHEGRLDSVDKVVEVYERAILAVTYSVDIWLHYCVFAISTYEDPDIIRRLFERGLAYVGTDYLSGSLWDEYIRYEEAHQAWSHLAMIYTRILENPIQQLDRYFNCFQELAASRPLSEIRTAEEAVLAATSVEAASEGLECEVHPDAVEQSSKPVSAGLTEAEELEKYIAIREEMYKKAKEFESKIIDFETAIKRPYFHIRTLDDPELENWHKYLDFIEGEGDLNKVVRLYERCLIACANYPEYWIRYVLSMESSGTMELADNALARASQVFVKKQPEIHLFAAKFKEPCGDVMGARAEYQLLYSEVSPCLVEAIVKHANMEYRLGNKEAAFSIYEKIIAAEQEKKQSQILPLLLVQYSRFLYLVAGNVEKARDILSGSLDHLQHSKPLLEAVIHLECILPPPKRIDYLDSLVEKFVAPNQDISNMASVTDREEISCIFMEFLDLFGDAQSIKKADSRHAKVFLRHKRTLGSRKRQADDLLASDKEKVSRTSTSVSSSGQPVMGAYPSAQNQWPSGYEQNVQSWPQNSQAQGQAWDPSYTQQAGYNAYGYANYGPPQMPTPAPQTAPYGSYVPTYPAQAYPVQNYAPPPTAPAATAYPQQQAPAATAFPQQQAPAAQPYYGYY